MTNECINSCAACGYIHSTIAIIWCIQLVGLMDMGVILVNRKTFDIALMSPNLTPN